jgi:hypothetical protein
MSNKSKRPYTIDIFQEALKRVHGDEIALDASTYKNTQVKAKFIDKDYGEFWAKPSNILRPRSHHPERSRIIKKQRRRHAAGYIDSELTKRGIKRLGSYENYHTLMELQCLTCGHNWQAQAANIISGKTGCPPCGWKRTSQKLREDISKIEEICREQNVELMSEYIAMNKHCTFKCRSLRYNLGNDI